MSQLFIHFTFNSVPAQRLYLILIEDIIGKFRLMDEAEDIIAQYPTMQVDEFTNKSNALEEEHFRDEIRLGSCRDSVRVVKTFRTRIAEVKARNKKPPVAYERILKQASERSLSELAVALDSTPDDVRVLFEDIPDEDEIRQN